MRNVSFFGFFALIAVTCTPSDHSTGSDHLKDDKNNDVDDCGINGNSNDNDKNKIDKKNIDNKDEILIRMTITVLLNTVDPRYLDFDYLE